MSYFETKSLLQNTLQTPIQADVSQTKYPCTGFCYMVVKNIDKILDLYDNKKSDEYYEFIKNLILQAGERKKNNSQIPFDGEYINADTVKNDFSDVYQKLEYKELGSVVDGEYDDLIINNIAILLFNINQKGFIIVNRSSETFVAIKKSDEYFLIVDSHQNINGEVDFIGLCNYITKKNDYQGIIQLGIDYN